MSENTYIEIDYFDMEEGGAKHSLGIKIDMLLSPEISALDAVRKLLPNYLDSEVVDARFIAAEEYEREYGESGEES